MRSRVLSRLRVLLMRGGLGRRRCGSGAGDGVWVVGVVTWQGGVRNGSECRCAENVLPFPDFQISNNRVDGRDIKDVVNSG
jgi:hypothetical protein